MGGDEVMLTDSSNNIISQGDIVKAENLRTDEVIYYLYTSKLLCKYDKLGNIDEESLVNIKVDDGVTLVNDETWKWTRLGSKEEVYGKIFK
jgi:hypothetical protein